MKKLDYVVILWFQQHKNLNVISTKMNERRSPSTVLYKASIRSLKMTYYSYVYFDKIAASSG